MLEELVLAIATITFREAFVPRVDVALVEVVALVVLVLQRLQVQVFHLQFLAQL